MSARWLDVDEDVGWDDVSDDPPERALRTATRQQRLDPKRVAIVIFVLGSGGTRWAAAPKSDYEPLEPEEDSAEDDSIDNGGDTT